MTSFLKWANKANHVLLGIETVIMAVITFFLVAAIFIEVVCRYFLFISVAWAEELTRYLFIWLTYIGSSYALYYGQHTEIDMLQQVILKSRSGNREKGLKALRIAAIVSTFAFLVVFGKVFFDYFIYADCHFLQDACILRSWNIFSAGSGIWRFKAFHCSPVCVFRTGQLRAAGNSVLYLCRCPDGIQRHLQNAD